MPADRVVLVRHGQSTWNASRRWQGHGGSGLSPLGVAQARATAAVLDATERPVTMLAASDLQRVTETIAPTAAMLDLPVTVDVRLREIDVGWWSGLTADEVQRHDPEGFAALRADTDVRRGGAETEADLRVRVGAVIDDLVERCDGGTLLAFTHGGVIRAAVAAVLDLTLAQSRRLAGPGNCSLTVIDARPPRRLRTYAQTAHLDRHD